MKKILVILFTLLMLVGCSTSKGYSKLSNGSDVLFKGPNSTYTKEDLYKALKVSSLESIENDLLNKISDKLQIDYTDVEKEADEMIDLYKQMGYESVISQYYGSLEAYKESYIKSAVLTKLTEVYINDNYDKFVEDDKPVKMQLVYFFEKEKAEAFITAVNSGSTFEGAAANNGYEYECPVQVYLDSDELLPINIKSYLNETASTGISSIIVSSSDTTDAEGNATTVDTYYVLNIVSRDVNDYKDEYISKKAANIEAEVVKEYMFSKHDIEFFDQDIYEIMKAQYEVLQ